MLQRSSDVPSGSKLGDQDLFNEEDFPGAKAAVVLWDVGTDWVDNLPRLMRSTEQTRQGLQHFKGHEEVKEFYCDGAPELKRACLEVGIMNPTSTPGCPETNGRAEAKVKLVKASTRCAVVQSGLNKTFWEMAAPYVGFAHCLRATSRWHTDPKQSAYERRHGEACTAMLIPFGALVAVSYTHLRAHET